MDGIQKVRDGHFAFFAEELRAYQEIINYYQPHEICDTKIISISIDDSIGIIVKKYSPLRESFLINFLWMKEVGIFYKIHMYWNGKKLSCISRGHYESVRIEYLAPVFLILVLVYVISLFILICEIIIKLWSRKEVQNNQV